MQHVRFVDIPRQINPLNDKCRVAMEVQRILCYWLWFVNRQTRKGGLFEPNQEDITAREKAYHLSQEMKAMPEYANLFLIL